MSRFPVSHPHLFSILGPVHKYPFSVSNRNFFSVFACHLHVSDENSHRNQNFSKTMAVEFDLVTSLFSEKFRFQVSTQEYENDVFNIFYSDSFFFFFLKSCVLGDLFHRIHVEGILWP